MHDSALSREVEGLIRLMILIHITTSFVGSNPSQKAETTTPQERGWRRLGSCGDLAGDTARDT